MLVLVCYNYIEVFQNYFSSPKIITQLVHALIIIGWPLYTTHQPFAIAAITDMEVHHDCLGFYILRVLIERWFYKGISLSNCTHRPSPFPIFCLFFLYKCSLSKNDATHVRTFQYNPRTSEALFEWKYLIAL